MVMNIGGGETGVIDSTVFEKNTGALTTANAIKRTPRTKQIGVKYHFFRHNCDEGSGVTLVKVDTILKKAYIFTNGMAPKKFITMRKLVYKL